jgi:cell division septation protein DedD
MAQTDGEKELVLGNKQLISLFFVIVALCGVFFALGYMMGRPSGKQLVAIPDSSPSAAPSPAPTQLHEAEPSAADTTPALPDAQPTAVAPQTQPAHDVPGPAPAPAPAAGAPAASATITPEAGATYLQVTALGRTDADHLVKTLREQNFPALLAESSKPELFRVLVGPYRQTADVADAKARLKALGFANAFVQK